MRYPNSSNHPHLTRGLCMTRGRDVECYLVVGPSPVVLDPDAQQTAYDQCVMPILTKP